MAITVRKLENDLHFEAENEKGGKLRMDGNNTIGGLEGGLSPMQLLLAGIGGCSSVDVLNILNKQRQQVEDYRVEITADKQSVGTYSEYKTINLNFILEGDLDEQKVERAIELSINKYCSVSKALEKISKISYSYEIKQEIPAKKD